MTKVPKGLRDASGWFGSGPFCRRAKLTVLGILLCVLTAPFAAAQTKNAKTVLLLFADVEQRTNFVELLEPALEARVPGGVTFHEIYMEDPVVDITSYYLDAEAESFRRRFERLKPDLVIAASPMELLFALHYRDKMFTGVPILFTEVGTRQFTEGGAREFGAKSWAGVTGLTVPVGLGETIDLALRLEPDTEVIALIAPAGDPFWLEATHKEIRRYRDRVREIDLIGPPGP